MPRSSAQRQAREVVGLYGDPDSTWGIAVDVGLRTGVDLTAAQPRLEALCARFAHLGPALPVEQVQQARWGERRAALVAAPYTVGEPPVRIAATAPSPGAEGRLLVAAHHGVCDGLGLLAVAAAAAGVEVTPLARGIGDLAGRGSFLRVSMGRVLEALRDPPPRFGATGSTGASGAGEELVVRELPRLDRGTVDLCLAVARVHAGRTAGSSSDRFPLLVVGASRRAAGPLAPDRRTAYLRFRADPAWDRATARRRFLGLAPEPDFPETSAAGLGPLVTRALRRRLGSTAVVSNLGVLAGELTSVSMFPALSGPRAVALGLASTSETTTLTLRTRRRDFTPEESRRLLDAIVDEWRSG